MESCPLPTPYIHRQHPVLPVSTPVTCLRQFRVCVTLCSPRADVCAVILSFYTFCSGSAVSGVAVGRREEDSLDRQRLEAFLLPSPALLPWQATLFLYRPLHFLLLMNMARAAPEGFCWATCDRCSLPVTHSLEARGSVPRTGGSRSDYRKDFLGIEDESGLQFQDG